MAKYRIIEVHGGDEIYYIIKKKVFLVWVTIESISVVYDLSGYEPIKFSTLSKAEDYIFILHPNKRIVKEITI